jgi:hypothetical protein
MPIIEEVILNPNDGANAGINVNIHMNMNSKPINKVKVKFNLESEFVKLNI